VRPKGTELGDERSHVFAVTSSRIWSFPRHWAVLTQILRPEIASLPGLEPPQGELTIPDFEERWTGGYIFENRLRRRWVRAKDLRVRGEENGPASFYKLVRTKWRPESACKS
jgi:hypothetical protein